MHFWVATAILPIFHNGGHQFCISVNTWRTGDPNFRGVGNWKFCSRTHFWELQPFFPFSVMADTNFALPSTLGEPETQTLGGSVIGSFALGCIFGELRPFFPFPVMADTNFAFPSTLGEPETQTLRGLVIGSFALGRVFGELRPFFPFAVMADTNFAFPSTLGEPETQTLGVSNWKFCSRTHFWGATAIFPIFSNGRHQFCISVNTRRTGDPNFSGSVIGSFALVRVFGELQPFFPFSVMADTNVLTLGKLE